jgi:hypothetical protein
MNNQKICTTCGTQYPVNSVPEICTICSDERQYVPLSGQSWTSLDELSKNHSVIINKINDGLYELKVAPSFAISQRALLILTPEGNILWDCIPLLNEPTIAFINSLGGLKAIAFSHPHYYSTMNDWAAVFNCLIYIHQSDEPWILNRGPQINLWSGREKELWEGIRIINVGGHFPGSSILHVPFLSPKGAVLCGDTFNLAPNMNFMSVMYSYPNKIPLPVSDVRRIENLMKSLDFDTMHGFWDFQNLYGNAKVILEYSLAKYF